MSRRRILPSLFTACSLCACASLPRPPLVPPSSRLPDQPGLADAASPEIVRPGDTVIVEVGEGPEQTTRQVLVDAEGSAHVAGGVDVRVGGLTLVEAEAAVQTALRRFDRQANVFLRKANAAAQRVRVFGAVAEPGTVSFVPNMRVLDAVAAAGGVALTPDGVMQVSLDDAVVLRGGAPLAISMRRALAAEAGHNVRLQPGDQIYFPAIEPGTITIFGQVGSPGVFTHRPGMRLSEALAEAGGVTDDGDTDDVRLIRGSIERPKAYAASLEEVTEGRAADVVLARDDVLFVEDDPLEDVGEALGLFTAILPTVLLVVLLTVADG